jgi:hypothetical protein
MLASFLCSHAGGSGCSCGRPQQHGHHQHLHDPDRDSEWHVLNCKPLLRSLQGLGATTSTVHAAAGKKQQVGTVGHVRRLATSSASAGSRAINDTDAQCHTGAGQVGPGSWVELAHDPDPGACARGEPEGGKRCMGLESGADASHSSSDWLFAQLTSV